MEKQFKKYFLGANSCEGFVSHFSDCYSPEMGYRALIIKGGPGTGKSSFMKYIAAAAQKKGYDTELCICSSDPQSLDGIIINDIKTVLLDGTSPHVVEPKYPGVCEEIINLGEFWDGKKLRAKGGEIIETAKQNKALHKRAAGYLGACGQLIYDNLKTSRAYTDLNLTTKFAEALSKKLIPQKGGKGYEWIRFIQGITPLGVVAYTKTLSDFCKHRVIIEDRFGSVSGIITETIRKKALSCGYEIITLRNPFLPSELIDHIMIPELSLCVATENSYIHFETDDRRIHSRRFVSTDLQRNHRTRLSFNRSLSRDILLAACETLQMAKEVHDELEKYYVNAIDFSALTQRAEETAKKLNLK